MSYKADIIADSISPDGVRLTTLEVTFPRFILAEVNTHRMLSRNSASSRAIPPDQQIERVLSDPFIPATFNKRVKGMGVGEPLSEIDQCNAREAWTFAMFRSIESAEMLLSLDCDKSRINRLLEPFLWHTAVITATEWSNFFALRDHPEAQPEFQIIASMMGEVMRDSVPQELGYGQWHLPYITDDELTQLCNDRKNFEYGVDERVQEFKLVSVRRCAAISYMKHAEGESWEDSIEKAKRHQTSGHVSPFEHVARPLQNSDDLTDARATLPIGELELSNVFVGNFRGWHQFRKELPHEDDFAKIRWPEEVPA